MLRETEQYDNACSINQIYGFSYNNEKCFSHLLHNDPVLSPKTELTCVNVRFSTGGAMKLASNDLILLNVVKDVQAHV